VSVAKYFGLFKSIEDVREEFKVEADAPFPSDENIVVAGYDYESYEGEAWVLYKNDDGNLYEVNGSHCSCHGLEGQWEPEATSWDALAIRDDQWSLTAVKDAVAAAKAISVGGVQ
jgi:hypothetical protein